MGEGNNEYIYFFFQPIPTFNPVSGIEACNAGILRNPKLLSSL
jgi:hypothetical protein